MQSNLVNLQKNTCNYTFLKICRLLELSSNKKNFAQGTSSLEEPIKLISYLSFSVPKNDCIQLNFDKRTLTLNSLALLGLNGVFLKYYSEQAYLNKKNKLFAFVDFINIFEHRYFSLKYKIEKQYEQTLQDTPDFDQNYRITGVYQTNMQDIFSPFLALLLNKKKNVNDLKCLIKNLIKTDLTIHQFQEKWYKIPRYCRLILDYSTLDNKALGEKTKNNQSAIIIELFFDTYEKYLEYFNDTDKKQLLERVIKYYLNNQIHFTIKTTIKADVNGTINLNKNNKLGYTTWL